MSDQHKKTRERVHRIMRDIVEEYLNSSEDANCMEFLDNITPKDLALDVGKFLRYAINWINANIDRR